MGKHSLVYPYVEKVRVVEVWDSKFEIASKRKLFARKNNLKNRGWKGCLIWLNLMLIFIEIYKISRINMPNWFRHFEYKSFHLENSSYAHQQKLSKVW